MSFAAHMSVATPILDLFGLPLDTKWFHLDRPLHRLTPLELFQRPAFELTNTDPAAALTISALTFVVYHEITHILHGHLEHFPIMLRRILRRRNNFGTRLA